MTKEEKSLLVKDLGSRLLYGVKVTWDGLHPITLTPSIYSEMWKEKRDQNIPKVYLRPMSSMTEEEDKELSILLNYEFYIDDDYALVAEDDRHRITLDLMQVYIDYLNSHHFDYRTDDEGKTMIEKGLALEALEGMYDLKEK